MLKNLLFVCIFLSLGCQKNNDFVYDVPQEFEPYVKRFITEAAARGHQISINNLIIKYELSSTPFCATSNVITSGNDVQKIISIQSLICWQNDVQLETIIFHELGHCILGREHETSLMPKGDPKSIMYPDNATLYTPCVYPIGSPCDLLYRRAYYIDELFNPATPVPDWGK
ncbi:MAG: hypothetical protein ACHQFX_18280 [Chitinophagales bacterium]